MYKLLLCWRYLRTRYIALASVISVMLGVATLIVVNAVMDGCKQEAMERLHGIHSDLTLETRSGMEGAPDAEAHMAKIREVAGDYVVGMSPTVRVPAMLGFHVGQQYHTQQVMLVGVDETSYASVSDFGKYLQHPENREQLDFELKESGYDTIDHQADDPSRAKPRTQMESAGWLRRRAMAAYSVGGGQLGYEAPPSSMPAAMPATPAPSAGAVSPASGDPFAGGVSAVPVATFNPAKDQHTGCVLGIALASFRLKDGSDTFLQLPGDDIEITYPSAGRQPKPLSSKFTVVDFYESKMGDYDAAFVFVPLRKLQELRGMILTETCQPDPRTGMPDLSTGVASFTAIQIRLKEGADLNYVRDLVRNAFPEQHYAVSTWLDKQGPLLAAIQVETAVLNVLLFLIIAVAGFGILAIFYMIVVEKTRDIGILKSLGASSGGVMSIFLSYGLLLGVVGSGVGVIGGLLFVEYINEIADLLSALCGMQVFDPSVYHFSKIPTIVQPLTIVCITTGAVLIAVLASVMPARRAAGMHPVAALRWE